MRVVKEATKSNVDAIIKEENEVRECVNQYDLALQSINAKIQQKTHKSDTLKSMLAQKTQKLNKLRAEQAQLLDSSLPILQRLMQQEYSEQCLKDHAIGQSISSMQLLKLQAQKRIQATRRQLEEIEATSEPGQSHENQMKSQRYQIKILPLNQELQMITNQLQKYQFEERQSQATLRLLEERL